MGILLWVVRVVLALMFAVPAAFQLLGDTQWAAEFAQIGFGTWFLYAVAAVELGAAGLALYPPTSFSGAVLMLAITTGALVAQATLFGNVIHIGVYAAILLAAAVLFSRERLERR